MAKSWFLAWLLPPTSSTLCFKYIRVSPKVTLTVLPCVELRPKRRIREFRYCKSIVLSTNELVDGRAC